MAAATNDPVTPVSGGVRLRVRLTPRASRSCIGAVACEAEGAAYLKVMVTAPPEAGKANSALIALLAKRWKLPKTSFSIIAGLTDRRKVLFIEGDSSELCRRIAESARVS